MEVVINGTLHQIPECQTTLSRAQISALAFPDVITTVEWLNSLTIVSCVGADIINVGLKDHEVVTLCEGMAITAARTSDIAEARAKILAEAERVAPASPGAMLLAFGIQALAMSGQTSAAVAFELANRLIAYHWPSPPLSK